jgi:DHA2 family multidrug resistance protein
MLGLAVGSLQMLLDRGELQDWFSSTEIIVEAVVSGLAFYLFVVHSLTAKHPFVSLALFKDRNFVTGLFFMFSLAVVLFGSLALLSPFLQTLMSYPVATAGVAMAPRGAGTMIAMFIVGRMIGRVDTRYFLVLGFMVTAWSLWVMTGFTQDVAEWTILWVGTVQGIGFGLLFVPLSTITFATLAPQLRGEATGLFSLLRNLGGSIGISGVTSLLVSNTQVNHAEIVNHVTAFHRQFESAAVMRFWNPFTPAGQAALNAEVTRQAQMIAFINDFKLMMVIALLSIPIVFLLRKPRAQPAQSATPVD